MVEKKKSNTGDSKKKINTRNSKNKINKKDEHKLLMELEQETTRSRSTTFTAFLSISFILPALALKVAIPDNHSETINISKAVFMLGFVFYLLALIHYEWHHRYIRDSARFINTLLRTVIFGKKVHVLTSLYKQTLFKITYTHHAMKYSLNDL